MAKKQHYAFPKFPKHAKRVVNAQGVRVWVVNGREFISKRDYFEQLAAKAQATKEVIDNNKES